MKKIILSLVLLMSVGAVSGQTPEEKAKAKAEAKALKAATKQAKSKVSEAKNIYNALNLKIQEKKATNEEILSECKKSQNLLQEAFKSNLLDEKNLLEAYKLSSEVAFKPHNIMLMEFAAKKLPFDTVYMVNNLKMLTEGLHYEIINTKVTTGETGNEGYIKAKKVNLAQCGDHYIYAAQFEAACKRYESALECYDMALSYKEKYPEVAEFVDLRIPNEQIAYYAFHTAHDAKMYDAMDKYFDDAMKFADGAEGTKQVRVISYLERGDSASWAKCMYDFTVQDPEANQDYVQMLLAYYQKKGNDKMMEYADKIISVAPDLYIANYGKAYVLFSTEKYDEAFKYYQKCTEVKPEVYDGWYQCGLCKYRIALALNATISSIKDQKKAKATLEETKKLFGEAAPFFEKARECTPDEPSKWAYELKQCYTVTGQAAKAAEMDKLL